MKHSIYIFDSHLGNVRELFIIEKYETLTMSNRRDLKMSVVVGRAADRGHAHERTVAESVSMQVGF